MPASPEDWEAGGFGIYVHWPFCAAKCPYCDFNSHVRRAVDHARWRAALVAEIRRIAHETPGRQVASVFFGGGTPSLMEPETVEAVLEAAGEVWCLAGDLEVTLEANPTSVEAARFAAFRGAGVNRVSIGVQALEDRDLARLGRQHSAAEALEAVELARSVFERVSFDLIYARQDQTPEAWKNELSRALDLAPDHLSLYQLTIEPGTAFGALHQAGRLKGLPCSERAAELYEVTQDLCAAAGLRAYEVSNHARPGAECRHNLVYWRHGDYAGIGPGAHGRLTHTGVRLATQAVAAPEAWLQAAEAGVGTETRTPLAPEDAAAEILMMGLRLEEGVSADRFARLAGWPLDESSIDMLCEEGLAERHSGRLRATPAGRRVLDSLTGLLLAQPEDQRESIPQRRSSSSSVR